MIKEKVTYFDHFCDYHRIVDLKGSVYSSLLNLIVRSPSYLPSTPLWEYK